MLLLLCRCIIGRRSMFLVYLLDALPAAAVLRTHSHHGLGEGAGKAHARGVVYMNFLIGLDERSELHGAFAWINWRSALSHSFTGTVCGARLLASIDNAACCRDKFFFSVNV